METTTETRKNRFPGRCANCGGYVAAEAGTLTNDRPGRPMHITCPEAATTPTEAPTAPAAATNGQDSEIGVYVFNDGSIVKVQPNKAKTRVYALRWTEINGERLVDATEERVHGEWNFEAGLIAKVTGARRMTLDEAKAFILRYGQCVRCGRKLKAAESVERGIGPVCVKYFSAFRTSDDSQRVTPEPAAPAAPQRPAAAFNPYQTKESGFRPGSRAGGLWDDRAAAVANEADAEIEAWSEIFAR